MALQTTFHRLRSRGSVVWACPYEELGGGGGGRMTLGNRNGILPRPQRTRSGRTEIASLSLKCLAISATAFHPFLYPPLRPQVISERDDQSYILNTAAILVTAEDTARGRLIGAPCLSCPVRLRSPSPQLRRSDLYFRAWTKPPCVFCHLGNPKGHQPHDRRICAIAGNLESPSIFPIQFLSTPRAWRSKGCRSGGGCVCANPGPI